MDSNTQMMMIFDCTKQFSWIKQIPPTLSVKDLRAYELGYLTTFTLHLNPSGDTEEWNNYNITKPFITTYLTDCDGNVPRFEVGYGSVCIESLSGTDIYHALLKVLESVRKKKTSSEAMIEAGFEPTTLS